MKDIEADANFLKLKMEVEKEKMLSVRDQFAMAALPALISLHRAELRWKDVAPQAYDLADKMLEARK